MKNTLLDKGIITPSGEISKDKINLVAGAITQPFAEMVWVTTGGDMETINRLTDVLVSMNTTADRGKLFKIIKMLYGLMGLPFSEEAEPMDAAPDVTPANIAGVMEAVAAGDVFVNLFTQLSARYVINISFFNWTYIVCGIAVSVLCVFILTKVQKNTENSK